MEHSSHRKFL